MKAIAVFDIDEPIFDYSCDLHVWNEFGDVRLVKENILLRPLPSKDYWHKKDYADGWNACIDEIVGETE